MHTIGRFREPFRSNGRKFMQRICSSKPFLEQVHPDGLTRYPGFSSPNAVLRTIDWIGRGNRRLYLHSIVEIC
jgi:hypothetical protein